MSNVIPEELISIEKSKKPARFNFLNDLDIFISYLIMVLLVRREIGRSEERQYPIASGLFETFHQFRKSQH